MRTRITHYSAIVYHHEGEGWDLLAFLKVRSRGFVCKRSTLASELKLRRLLLPRHRCHGVIGRIGPLPSDLSFLTNIASSPTQHPYGEDF